MFWSWLPTIGGDAAAALEWGPKLFRDYRLYVAAEADEDLDYLLTQVSAKTT